MPQLNCECEAVSTYRTLLQLRTAILTRSGYASQAANPPPGIADEVDQCIRDAQLLLYRKHKELRTERFFRWSMEIGERFYGFPDNDVSTDIECSKSIDPYTVTWVGLEDLNGRFTTLHKGIKPEWYTHVDNTSDYPTHYELRGCIEIFPKPQGAYFLWVKGRFGLEPLATNSDRTTLDDFGVYLLALGNFKKGRGKSDADAILTQASTYEQALVAGTHGTKRYIPGAEPVSSGAEPRMVTFVGPGP